MQVGKSLEQKEMARFVARWTLRTLRALVRAPTAGRTFGLDFVSVPWGPRHT